MVGRKAMTRLLMLGMVLVLGFALVACGGGETARPASGGASKGTLTIGVTPWTSTIPPTYVAKNILEELGYQVKLQDAEVGVVFAGLSKGDIDIFMDSWLPDMHKNYMEEYGANIEKVALSYPDGDLGWVVPTYVKDVKSIADLKDHKAEFEGKVIGIDAGAGMMRTSREVIDAYGLDYELVEGSEAAMMTVLKDYYGEKKPVIVLGWRPHSMFAQYDLKFLEDPKGFWKRSEVWVLAHKGLRDKAPEAYQFLKKWSIPVGDIEQMILKMDTEKADPDDLAKQWIKDNRDKVDAMLDGTR